MVDVGGKPATQRIARARARLRMSPSSAGAVSLREVPKGEVLGVARLAGIQAAKQTPALIPLAHPLALTFVDVDATVDSCGGPRRDHQRSAHPWTHWRRDGGDDGRAVAALTVYDMVKGLERGVDLEEIVLLEKHGGRRRLPPRGAARRGFAAKPPARATKLRARRVARVPHCSRQHLTGRPRGARRERAAAGGACRAARRRDRGPRGHRRRPRRDRRADPPPRRRARVVR